MCAVPATINTTQRDDVWRLVAYIRSTHLRPLSISAGDGIACGDGEIAMRHKSTSPGGKKILAVKLIHFPPNRNLIKTWRRRKRKNTDKNMRRPKFRWNKFGNLTSNTNNIELPVAWNGLLQNCEIDLVVVVSFVRTNPVKIDMIWCDRNCSAATHNQ